MNSYEDILTVVSKFEILLGVKSSWFYETDKVYFVKFDRDFRYSTVYVTNKCGEIINVYNPLSVIRSDDQLIIKDSGYYGLINENGDMSIPCKFLSVYKLYKNKYKVRIRENEIVKTAVLDKDGNIILDFGDYDVRHKAGSICLYIYWIEGRTYETLFNIETHCINGRVQISNVDCIRST